MTKRKISENFSLDEFFSPNDKGETFRATEPKIELLATLEAIRGGLGRPLHIESGIRSVEHNAALPGSAPDSAPQPPEQPLAGKQKTRYPDCYRPVVNSAAGFYHDQR